MKKWRWLLLCAALSATLSFLGARADWMTNDEGPFLHYGVLHLRGTVERKQVWNSKLPVNALHALPLALDAREPIARDRVATWALLPARCVSVLLGAVLVVAVGLLARSLAGPRAGAAAALFAALEPNLLAHGHLVTADGGATLATTLSAAALVRFVRSKSLGDAALLGAALGFVLLTKFMLVVWVGAVLVAILVARAWNHRAAAVAVVALLLVLNAGFFFRGLPGHLPDAPKSRKVSLAKTLVGRAPLPVAEPWLDGLDWTAGDEEQGRGFGNLYLLGETQTERRGWAWYYVVAFLVKVPLPLLALAGLGLARNRGRVWWSTRLLALAWFAFMSLGNRAQIGIRHALPIVPLLLLEAGAAYADLERHRPWAARALVVWLAASVLSFAPDFIPYTNELVLDRREAYRVLADSNVDWGQSKLQAIDFLRANHDVAFEPSAATTGRVLVSVNALVGVTEPPERYAWLRGRAPVAHVRHAYLLFDVR